LIPLSYFLNLGLNQSDINLISDIYSLEGSSCINACVSDLQRSRLRNFFKQDLACLALARWLTHTANYRPDRLDPSSKASSSCLVDALSLAAYMFIYLQTASWGISWWHVPHHQGLEAQMPCQWEIWDPLVSKLG